MRGRKPTATATKKLTGNPGKRPLNEKEPQYPAGLPACPVILNDDGREVWNSVGSLLAERGVITEADALVLMLLCDAVSDLLAARRVIADDGIMLDDKRHPCMITIEKARKQIQSLASEFGLTPVSRTRVKADTKPKQENPLKALLASRGNSN